MAADTAARRRRVIGVVRPVQGGVGTECGACTTEAMSEKIKNMDDYPYY